MKMIVNKINSLAFFPMARAVSMKTSASKLSLCVSLLFTCPSLVFAYACDPQVQDCDVEACDPEFSYCPVPDNSNTPNYSTSSYLKLTDASCNDNYLWNTQLDTYAHSIGNQVSLSGWKCKSMLVQGKYALFGGTNTSDYRVKLAYMDSDSNERGTRKDVVILPGLTLDYDGFNAICKYLTVEFRDDIHRCWVISFPAQGGSDYFKYDYNVSWDSTLPPDQWDATPGNAELWDISSMHALAALYQQISAIDVERDFSPGQLVVFGYSKGGQFVSLLQDRLIASGKNLSQHNVDRVGFFAPAIPCNVNWQYVDQSYGTCSSEGIRMRSSLVGYDGWTTLASTLNWGYSFHTLFRWGTDGMDMDALIDFDNSDEFVKTWWADGKLPEAETVTTYGAVPSSYELSAMINWDAFRVGGEMLGFSFFYTADSEIWPIPGYRRNELLKSGIFQSGFRVVGLFGTHDKYINSTDVTNYVKFIAGSNSNKYVYSADASHGSLLVSPEKSYSFFNKLIR